MDASASVQRPLELERAPALSDEQQQAVDHGSGALLVFAGPGSGKTRVLTERIAHLLSCGRAQPREILALTFTVRATEEMRVRLTALVGQQVASAVTVATFHGLCARILRAHPHPFGRTAAFSIYDADDVLRLIRDELVEGDDELPDADQRRVLERIALAKSRLWTPSDIRARWGDADGARIAETWCAVERELRRCDAFDFADLVTNTVTLLRAQSAVRSRHRALFHHIVVDEFQDTDRAQFALVGQLAGPAGGAPHGSLVVCGDDDQLLYGWRGADVDNLLDFQRAFPCATELVLRRNYRSAPEILQVATRCVAHNTRRRAKALIAIRPAGGRVRVACFACDRREAASLAREISDLIARGIDPLEILVLCRSLRFTVPLQHALTSAGIPYRVIGAHSLWERVEVLDALAYVALVANPHDTVAFRRAIGAPSDRRQFTKSRLKAPTRGVGAATQRAVIRYARESQVDLLQSCVAAHPHDGRCPYLASAAAREALVAFGEQLAEARRAYASNGKVAKAVIAALTITAGPVDCYDELLEHTDNVEVAPDCARVKEDLRSLCRAAHSYEAQHGSAASLAGFLHQTRVEPAAVLSAEQDTRLTISTIHGAKGTEARVVFVIGCEERLLPTGYAIDSTEPLRVEEERRLFYVAATRAKNRLTLTTAAERLGSAGFGASRFLAEAHGKA